MWKGAYSLFVAVALLGGMVRAEAAEVGDRLPVVSAADAKTVLTLRADGVAQAVNLGHHAVSAGPGSPTTQLVTPGGFDSSFGMGGLTLTRIAEQWGLNSTVVQPDDKILVSGAFWEAQNCNVYVARYNADGSLDTAFAGGAGFAVTTIGSSTYFSGCSSWRIALQADGKIVGAGSRPTEDGGTAFILLRYTASGFLDRTFGVNGMVVYDYAYDNKVPDVVIQPDGKIVIAGSVVVYNSGDFNIIFVRFTSTGAVDTSFGDWGHSVYGYTAESQDYFCEITLQPDGKILALTRAAYGSSFDFGLMRLTASGVLDTTFGSGGRVAIDVFGSSDEANAVAVQADGKILVAGMAYHPTGDAWYMTLLRLNAAGTAFDTAFSPAFVRFGAGYNVITDVAVQSDGKIVAAGWTQFDRNNLDDRDAALLRYLPNGSLDSSFLGGGGFAFEGFTGSTEYTSFVGLQLDGKIVMSGESHPQYLRLSRHHR